MFRLIPRSSTNLLVCGILFACLPGVGLAQQAALSLSSGTAVPGGSVGLSLSLTNSGSAQPGAIEWTMTYPSTEFSGVSIAAGPVATAAGAAPTCSSGVGTIVCVLDGMQEAAIGNGVVATVTLGVPATAPGGAATVAISSPVVVGLNGSSIPAASVGANVSIQAQPALTGLSCSPSSVTAPGSATCTVTLSAAALTGGSAVSLSSNNTSVTVPASVTVAAGSTTAAFTASVASVSSALTATLTARYGSASQTFSLGVTPPATYSISGTIAPAVSGVTVTLSGTASQTTASSSTGGFTFTGLQNGSYTVTPTLSGYTFTPTSQSVTVNGANPAAITFTAAVQPSLSAISCTPSSVTAPGSAACTVTLSAAAPAGGSVVALSSNSTSVTVPPSATVAAAATTAAFTATVASVSSALTATLTATFGSKSQTFALGVAPPVTWTISGTITPAVSGVTVTLSGAASNTADVKQFRCIHLWRTRQRLLYCDPCA